MDIEKADEGNYCPNCGSWLALDNEIIWETEEKKYCKSCAPELLKKIDKKIKKLQLTRAKIEYKIEFGTSE
ncbi:MAG: hypothetical protein K8E24_003115 [Methanobacterium paludis]|nr:hypothetical protein [Methanobacterium paludis]